MRDEAQNPQEGAGRQVGASRLIVLAVLVGSLLAGAAAGGFLLGPRLFATPSEAEAEPEKKAEPSAEPTTLVLLENLVVNPANSGGTRFLLISFAFDPGSADASAIRSAEPRLRDAFVTLLARRTIAELSDLALRDSLRAELLRAADSIVPGIERLYIPQFVMQ